jgi:endo-1,4-beta-xylanase
MKHLRIAIVFAACAVAFGQSLRELAEQRAVRIGAAVDPSRFTEAAYADTLAREFNQAEPENAMKFGPIHPGLATYNFTQPDAIVAFARAHNMAVRGHTLVWYNQNPSWLTGGGYTPAQLSGILQDHIKTVVGHFAGKIYAWDVVNEAFNDDGTFRSTIWSDAPGIGLPGTAYIEQAFRWARATDPKALLFYNDYSAELTNAKSDTIYEMAQDFKTRGVPLDGIGLQMHFTTSTGSLASIESNIKRITDLGLEVQITELDVRLPVDSSGTATAANLATQAQIYRDVVALCLKFSRCTAIQTWGFTDKYSWVPGTFAGMGAALEFDAAYRPKQAYDSIAAALKTVPPVIAAAGLTNAASYATEGVAPGEIAVLFGPTFGPAALSLAEADPAGKLPVKLSDVRVLFDGIPAPLLYSRVGQVSAIVPFAVAGSTTTQLQYEYQGIVSNTVSVPVKLTVPGLFTLDSSGKGAGAILDTSYHVVSRDNPARKGDYLLLFATGGGATTPASVDGQIALVPPIPIATAKVTATIGGIDCPVQYAGGASGLVAGALQVNVQVARDVPAGDQPVVLTIGGASSPPGVTVLVQ